jgi:histidinol-phosphate aminotransferase
MKQAWLRETIRDFEPYKVPEIKESIVINANESPYNIFDFPAVKKDFLDGLEKLSPYHYPDPFADTLRKALGAYVSVPYTQTLAGNGGDEIIQLILNTFINPGDTILVHSPTFDVYEIDAAVLGAKTIKVPDEVDFKRNEKAVLQAIEKVQPKVTFICNPNNPTGAIWPLEVVEGLIKASPNPVVVDEAYLEFSQQESVISLLPKYDNLIVIRTLSKAFGLAGFRLGYCVANDDVIDAISLTKASYNLNSVTQLMGIVALAHSQEILQHNVPPTIAVRDYLIEKLNRLPGIQVFPSSTNFIFVRTPDGNRYGQALSKADICVRSYGIRPELANCLRITATTKTVADLIVDVFQKEADHA